MMMNLMIAGLALFVLRATADIDETPDYGAFLLASSEELPDDSTNDVFLLASNEELPDDSTNDVFLLSSGGVVPDDSTNLYTEPFDDSFQSSRAGFIASSQPDCTSSNDNPDNLFLSRLRRRIDACLPPLTPPPNIYDSNSILNQLAPPVTLPRIPGREKNDRTELERLLELPDLTRDTDPEEQDDVCPKELVGESQIPVCSSRNIRRDHLRPPRADFYTLYNIRHWFPLNPCERLQRLWCCFVLYLAHHPLDPREAPDVLTGFICKNPEDEAFQRAFLPIDQWSVDSTDPGKPLEESPSRGPKG